jgi:amidophosphoribosyltransferase
MVNYVKEIYRPFTDEEISAKMAENLKPADCEAEIELVFQTVDNLHKACPGHTGDWYFTGNYPTPRRKQGGKHVVLAVLRRSVDGRAY